MREKELIAMIRNDVEHMMKYLEKTEKYFKAILFEIDGFDRVSVYQKEQDADEKIIYIEPYIPRIKKKRPRAEAIVSSKKTELE